MAGKESVELEVISAQPEHMYINEEKLPKDAGHVNKSTLYMVVCISVGVAAAASIGSGILVYRITSTDRECKLIVPEGYVLSPQQGFEHTTTETTMTTSNHDATTTVNITSSTEVPGCVVGAAMCPDSWITFQGSCYLFGHDQGLTYVEAEHFCTQQHGGSHLVHVNDEHEQNFLRDMMIRFKAEYYWMGLDDRLIEGEWRWLDTNTSPGYTDWGLGQPNSYGGNEDCGGFHQKNEYHWNDFPCNSTVHPVCEKQGCNVEVVG